MYNIRVRLNAVTFFAFSVLFGLTAMCCMSTYFHEGQAVVKTLRLNNIRSLRYHNGADRALFSFDVEADLSPVWHWNSNYLFVYIVAEYQSDANVLNQVVIWDKIIDNKERLRFKQTNEFVKYALIDQGSELRGKEVTLTLMWDHMPITGLMCFESVYNNTFQLPLVYKDEVKQ
mmetsp:Transcript_16740/g.25139  ORF Transcript_16740/g.25139 Transcript_16740/m.25139 type:complete len:174 (+) Transcript_16740:179-700(+)